MQSGSNKLMEKSFKIGTYITLLFITISSILVYFYPVKFRFIVDEDGVIENLTAFVLLLGSVCLSIRFAKVAAKKNMGWIVFNLLMILGLFFCFGEEISWGQRIFSIDSSRFFLENNSQQETNFHNLEFNGIKLNKLIFANLLSIVLGIYLTLSLITYKKSFKIRRLIEYIGLPVPRILHSVLVLISSVLVVSTNMVRKWEVLECLIVAIFFLILLDPYNQKEKLFARN